MMPNWRPTEQTSRYRIYESREMTADPIPSFFQIEMASIGSKRVVIIITDATLARRRRWMVETTSCVHRTKCRRRPELLDLFRHF